MEAIIEKIKEYKIIVICTGLGLLVGGFFLLKPTPQTPVKETNLQAEVAAISKDSSTEKDVKKEEKEEPVEQDLITVDVKGAVKAPGIYDLPVGSRVNDAVQKAGGLTEQADSKSLNLAQKVSDEALVYVPTKGEEAASQQAGPGTASSDEQGKEGQSQQGQSGRTQAGQRTGRKTSSGYYRLPETNGKFKSVDELKKVSGIGAKTIEKLKDYVTVD